MALYRRDECARAHGIEVLELGSGRARITMVVRADMTNGHGICHGGMTFLLADTALAYAATATPEPTVVAAADIRFLAAVRLGDVLVADCARTYQRGRNSVYDVVLTRGDGTVVALYRGTARQLGGPLPAERTTGRP
jgi:acyl-CoA thioesterase